MPLKKAVIILIIMAIISAFVFIYYQKSLKSNLSQSESGGAAISQKPLTNEEKRQRLFNALKTLNSQGEQIRENLTPSEERAKKQELLNELKALAN